MRVVYFGDGPWAHTALRLIIAQGYEVVKVIVRSDFRDPMLVQIAEENGIASGFHPNVNSEEFRAELQLLQADIAISMSFNQIIRRELLDMFPLGFINCHAGKLPLYRGRNILNWALINDEREIGVTCHYISEGIDTGDIILQKTFPVSDADDYATVLEQAIKLCPEVLLEALNAIRDGVSQRVQQPVAGTYFIARKEGDEFIDWSWPSRQVFNFVRAITKPGPCARTWLHLPDGLHLVVIEKVRLVPGSLPYMCSNGAVVGISADGYPVVKTGDTTIEVMAYTLQHATRKKLRVGDRLGLNLNLLLPVLRPAGM